MLDTAWRQLRYNWAVATGREIRISDVRGLIDLLATRAEFGGLGDEQIRDMLGNPVDPEVRTSMDSRRWRKAVQRAYRTSYYHDALDGLGLSPDELSLERVAELPPTPKAAVRSSPEAFLKSRGQTRHAGMDHGHHGRPTTFWFSRHEVELALQRSARSWCDDLARSRESGHPLLHRSTYRSGLAACDLVPAS